MIICGPTFLGILAFIASYVFMYYFSLYSVKIYKGIRIKHKLLYFVFIIIVFIIIGWLIEQGICIHNLKTDETPERVKLYHIYPGVIEFSFTDNNELLFTGKATSLYSELSDSQAKFFYRFNGLEYLSGNPRTSRIRAKVPDGKEFSKLCRIRSYSQIWKDRSSKKRFN